jgi:hypothetical protein
MGFFYLEMILTAMRIVNYSTKTTRIFFTYTGCGKKTSPISNGSYKQIKKDTEKIL